jgi:hypothetical protein
LEGAVEGFLAGCVDLVGLTVVDLVRRHQADASMVMILIIPIELYQSKKLRQNVFASSMQRTAEETEVDILESRNGFPRTGCRSKCRACYAIW